MDYMVDKWDYIKLKPSATINRMERQSMEQEKQVENHISDKESISKIYKEPQWLTFRGW